MKNYKQKYLKYKKKYLELKGGSICSKSPLHQHSGECWSDSIQAIFLYHDLFSDEIQKLMYLFYINKEDIMVQYLLNLIKYKKDNIYHSLVNINMDDDDARDKFIEYAKIILKNISMRFINRVITEEIQENIEKHNREDIFQIIKTKLDFKVEQINNLNMFYLLSNNYDAISEEIKHDLVVGIGAVPVVDLGAVPVVDPGAVPVVDPGAVPVVDPGAVPVVDPGAVPVVDPGAVPEMYQFAPGYLDLPPLDLLYLFDASGNLVLPADLEVSQEALAPEQQEFMLPQLNPMIFGLEQPVPEQSSSPAIETYKDNFIKFLNLLFIDSDSIIDANFNEIYTDISKKYYDNLPIERMQSPPAYSIDVCINTSSIINHNSNYKEKHVSADPDEAGGSFFDQIYLFKLLTYLLIPENYIPMYSTFIKDEIVNIDVQNYGIIINTKKHAMSLLTCNGTKKMFNNDFFMDKLIDLDWSFINNTVVKNLYLNVPYFVLSNDQTQKTDYSLETLINIIFYDKNTLTEQDIDFINNTNKIIYYYELVKYNFSIHPNLPEINMNNIVEIFPSKVYKMFIQIYLLNIIANSRFKYEDLEWNFNEQLKSMSIEDLHLLISELLNIKHDTYNLLYFINNLDIFKISDSKINEIITELEAQLFIPGSKDVLISNIIRNLKKLRKLKQITQPKEMKKPSRTTVMKKTKRK